MSGFWHTWKVSRDGAELVYRPPSGATEQDHEVGARGADALAHVVNPVDPPTVRLSAVLPEPTVWPHGKWFGTEDESLPPS